MSNNNGIPLVLLIYKGQTIIGDLLDFLQTYEKENQDVRNNKSLKMKKSRIM